MTEIYMTACDQCAEKMDAEKHPENPYYLTEVFGSRRMTQCTRCFQYRECAKYEMKSKAVLAMERAIERKKNRREGLPQRDTRARYREPFRGR